MSLLHGEGRQFESVTRYQYPISEMNITLCYERRSGGLIPSLGARVWKMCCKVRQRFAKPSFRNGQTGSIPVSSAKCWADSLMVKQSTHNRLSESSILSQPTSASIDKLVKSSLSKGEI